MTDSTPKGTPLRCTCGNLLACVTGRTVEIKCRRCKRIVEVFVLPAAAADDDSRGPPAH